MTASGGQNEEYFRQRVMTASGGEKKEYFRRWGTL